jgi:predicted RNA-binding protein with PIN domain
VNRQRFLIDGYNLLHACGIPTRVGPGDLQRARQRLVSLVRERFPDAECSIVFDGTKFSSRVEHGVRVLFSKGEADDLIRELLAHDATPKTLCVVSDDHEVQAAAKHRRAQAMDVEHFLRQLETRPRPIAPTPAEKPTADQDAQYWLDVFAPIDDDPALRRMQEIEPLGRRMSKKKKQG